MQIAKAYGIKYVKVTSSKNLVKQIQQVLTYNTPVICDVKSPEWQLIIPRVMSEKKQDGTLISRDYEDMYPYVDNQELSSNKISNDKNVS